MNSTRFYEQRRNCKCPSLESLWSQIKNVDDTQIEAQEYVERYVANKEECDGDVYFKRELGLRISKFDEMINGYQDIFVERCKDGLVVFEVDGREIGFEEALDEMNESDLVMKCGSCKTEIPHLRYPGWNE
jgi:hypothetical protein